jgi:hypothetical protein
MQDNGKCYYNLVEYDVGTSTIRNKSNIFHFEKAHPFKSGDVVGICFDMTHSSTESDGILKNLSAQFKQGVGDCGASIQFFKNRVSLCEPIKCIAGQSFVPTVDILGCQQVTLRPWIGASSGW